MVMVDIEEYLAQLLEHAQKALEAERESKEKALEIINNLISLDEHKDVRGDLRTAYRYLSKGEYILAEESLRSLKGRKFALVAELNEIIQHMDKAGLDSLQFKKKASRILERLSKVKLPRDAGVAITNIQYYVGSNQFENVIKLIKRTIKKQNW